MLILKKIKKLMIPLIPLDRLRSFMDTNKNIEHGIQMVQIGIIILIIRNQMNKKLSKKLYTMVYREEDQELLAGGKD